MKVKLVCSSTDTTEGSLCKPRDWRLVDIWSTNYPIGTGCGMVFLRHPGEECQKGIRIVTVSNVRGIASAAQQKILPMREKSFGEGISC